MLNNPLPLLSIEHLDYFYHEGPTYVPILKQVNWSIHRGEIFGLLGPSGSGKSTLLHLIGLLDNPKGGRIGFYCPRQKNMFYPVKDLEKTLWRRDSIGFIYQNHHLLPEFTALENVLIPLWICGNHTQEGRQWAEHLLCRVGLENRMNHFPSELSGGQRQRVAIARAMANRPSLLLADEPTGSLDEKTSDQIFELFLEVVQSQNIALIMASHNLRLIQQLRRCVVLRNHQVEPYDFQESIS
jgi:lipoprotein-releasing system ATP-binding protein